MRLTRNSILILAFAVIALLVSCGNQWTVWDAAYYGTLDEFVVVMTDINHARYVEQSISQEKHDQLLRDARSFQNSARNAGQARQARDAKSFAVYYAEMVAKLDNLRDWRNR